MLEDRRVGTNPQRPPASALEEYEEIEMSKIIEVNEITKQYGSVCAVDGVTFHVEEGEIFGIVGPNGAGKTTTIECIEGLRKPDSGMVHVLGFVPWNDRLGVAQRIGVQLQESALPLRIRVRESLDLFGALYEEHEDAQVLLNRLGLADKSKAMFSKLSGGQKQRLFIALALVSQPQVVFFDELTTGLDPHARRSMWDLVRQIRDQGSTVFLTTHFMEEAERLCDRVLIMDEGKIVALDTPEALIRSLGVERRLVFNAADHWDSQSLVALPQVDRVEQIGERVVVYGSGDRFASSVVHRLETSGVDFRDLRTQDATLEDVFLSLTGRQMREE
jgi:ABC-2 type transport system ATP-binding protein